MKVINFPTKQALLGAPIVADHEPWQAIVREWAQSNGASIFSVGIPRLRAWLKQHPGDVVTAERLAQWEQRLNEREAA